MGQDNNSPAENVHNMMSGTLGQCMDRERVEIHAPFHTNTYYTKHATRQQLTS